MDSAYAFAEVMTDLQYEDLPAEVVAGTKKQILDILGVALGGSSRPGIKELAQLAMDWGGKAESSLFCFGARLPAPQAAWVNAAMGHALDFDDTGSGPTHPSVVIVPTCLAAGEQKGAMRGKELIAAVALGTDMMCRLGQAFRSGQQGVPPGGHPGAGWHLTTLYGYVAAAAVAGRILALDQQQLRYAMGIAYHQCSGNGQCVTEGALTKRMGPGFAARGGITAACMAGRGITGAQQCLEGEVGLYPLYHHGQYASSELTRGLGREFLNLGVTMKPYPCCKGTHAFADAAMDLVHTHGIQAVDVAEITLFCSDPTSFLLFPLEKRSRPQNLVDAQFSIPWVVASVLAHGKASLGDFSEQGIHKPELLNLTARMKVIHDPAMDASLELPDARIAVGLSDGRTITAENKALERPGPSAMALAAYEIKFRDCVAHAAKPYSDRQVDALVEHIRHLDQLEDIHALVNLLR